MSQYEILQLKDWKFPTAGTFWDKPTVQKIMANHKNHNDFYTEAYIWTTFRIWRIKLCAWPLRILTEVGHSSPEQVLSVSWRSKARQNTVQMTLCSSKHDPQYCQYSQYCSSNVHHLYVSPDINTTIQDAWHNERNVNYRNLNIHSKHWGGKIV